MAEKKPQQSVMARVYAQAQARVEKGDSTAASQSIVKREMALRDQYRSEQDDDPQSVDEMRRRARENARKKI